MSGNWVLKVYIKENTPKRISKMVQKKNTKYKKNCCVNNYIDKPKKIIKKLKLAGVRYECYRVEYERASNYRQVFFSRTSGPYRCRYCNKRLSKKNVFVDHIIPVAKTQKNAMPKLQPKEIRQNGHVGVQRMAWKVPYILDCIEYHKSFKRFTDDIRNIVYLWNIYEVLTAQQRTLSQ